MPGWPYRLHVILPASDATPANAALSAIDPDVGGIHTFEAPTLSTDGNEPATHCWANSAATESMYLQMLDLVDNWVAYGLSAQPMVWQLNAESGTLQTSTVTLAVGQPWSADDTLAAASLLRVEVNDGI